MTSSSTLLKIPNKQSSSEYLGIVDTSATEYGKRVKYKQ